MSVFHNNALIGAGGGAGAAAADANITKSLRFNSADSAYLNRTPSSSGNRKTMTISFWYKNTVKSTSGQHTFIAGQFTSPAKDYYTKFSKLDDGRLKFNSRVGGSDTFDLLTTQVLRDPGAWYSIVLAIDTTQATASDRLKLYINGSQVTDFDTETQPSQNINVDYLNENQLHFIGRYLDNSYEYLDGYLTDFYFIDGSQLEPTSFGAYDDNGVWQASAYSGTYGTNGFHLFDFANESTIGHDSSGNENDFTANNLNTGGTNAHISASASPSGKSGFSSSYPGSYALDGSDTSQAMAEYSTGDTTTITVTFDPAITAGSTLTAKIYQYQTYHSMKVNSGSFVTASGSVVNLLSGHGVSAGDSISSITYRTVSPNSAFALGNELYYIKNGGTNIVSTPHENDVLFDVPQNDTTNTDSGAGGEVGGCYCTLNPLTSSGYTLSEGNLKVDSGSVSNRLLGTIGVSSGKYYFEAEFISHTSTNDSSYLVVVNEDGFEAGIRNRSADIQYFTSSGGNLGTYSSFNWVRGDIHGFALDCDNSQLKVYKNNTLTATISLTANKTYFPGYYRDGSNGSFIFNFGARKFAYAAPSGFKCLNTSSLPTPAVANGATDFDVLTWTGDNAVNRTLTGLSFSPDFVWHSARSIAWGSGIVDSVRGVGSGGPTLRPFNNSAEETVNNFGAVTALTSDGFTVSKGSFGSSQWAYVNQSSATYVSWNWNGGANSNKTYTVKVVSDNGNKYRFDDFGTSAVTLDLEEGSTYVFDQSDSSNSGHPLRFSTTSDGTHGGGSEYTTGVTATGTPGSAGAKTTIVVGSGVATLHYYCSAHSGMGGQANTNSTAGSSNFDGAIQTKVKANQTAGISIVTYTGPSSAGFQSVGHGLGAKPYLIISKDRDNGSRNWGIYHQDAQISDVRVLSFITNGTFNSGTAVWDISEIDNSTFTPYFRDDLGSSYSADNVAYCFTPIPGFSAFGTFEGNYSFDGAFIYTNFRPAFFMWKNIDSDGFNWGIIDSTRGPYNYLSRTLNPNAANSESGRTTADAFDFLSNGVKVRATGSNARNQNGSTFIWAAFAEHPFSSNGGLAR